MPNLVLLLLLFLSLLSGNARAAAPGLLDPFAVRNQSPLVQVYGLPVWYGNSSLAPGAWEGLFSLDVANHYSRNSNAQETILFDGESDRFALALRRGLAGGGEISLEIPWLTHRRGNLDSFINSWHDMLGITQTNRQNQPNDRLHFLYTRGTTNVIDLHQAASGFGDIAIGTAWPLFRPETAAGFTLTLGSRLELPTGAADELLGSGSTDLALWLAAHSGPAFGDGNWAVTAALGGLAMTPSDVLPHQQRRLVAFGRLGLGWSPADWIAFKLQLDGHTPFYRDSNLTELDATAGLLTIGGTLALPAAVFLDIGVVEDVIPGTAPDVAFQLALRRRF